MFPIGEEASRRAAGAFSPEGRRRVEAGWKAFTALAMPAEVEENWRYVDPGIDMAEYSFTDAPGSPASRASHPVEVRLGARVVDGFTVEASGGDGVEVVPLREAAGHGQPPSTADKLEAFNEAFCHDGVLVTAHPGASPADSVVIDVEATTGGTASAPRVRIVAGRSSHVGVVLVQRSPDGLPILVVPRVEVEAGDGATVTLTVVQQWGSDTRAVARHAYRLGRDATVRLAEAGLGGRYSRLHLTADLEGDGSAAEVVGAYFGDGEQTLDYRYFMRHAARGTTSDMFLKGAVAGNSRSVFTGLIRIELEGQKTSAHQTNRNLVLSDGAEAHSVPNLEILADDVRCGHGSAVGPLDDDQRYYLMSRGLERPRADRLQVKGFFEEALLRFPDLRFEPMLREAAMTKYEGVER